MKTFTLTQAKKYAFLLLKFRNRSQAEMRKRLLQKKFPEQIVNETLFFLKEKSFIDDAVFARYFCSARAKKYGPRRLIQELKQKGLGASLISEALAQSNKSCPPQKVAEEILLSRIGQYKSLDPRKARQRAYALLLRRGFEPELAGDLINKYLRDIS